MYYNRPMQKLKKLVPCNAQIIAHKINGTWKAIMSVSFFGKMYIDFLFCIDAYEMCILVLYQPQS